MSAVQARVNIKKLHREAKQQGKTIKAYYTIEGDSLRAFARVCLTHWVEITVATWETKASIESGVSPRN